MFYEMVCDACDGNGSVDAKTEDKVSKEVMVLALRKELIKQGELVKYFKSNCTCKTEENGHWDEFKTVAGGKQRLD